MQWTSVTSQLFSLLLHNIVNLVNIHVLRKLLWVLQVKTTPYTGAAYSSRCHVLVLKIEKLTIYMYLSLSPNSLSTNRECCSSSTCMKLTYIVHSGLTSVGTALWPCWASQARPGRLRQLFSTNNTATENQVHVESISRAILVSDDRALQGQGYRFLTRRAWRLTVHLPCHCQFYTIDACHAKLVYEEGHMEHRGSAISWEDNMKRIVHVSA